MATQSLLKYSISALLCTLILLSTIQTAEGQIVKRQSKISDTQGGFTGVLTEGDFGSAVAYLGDLNGDGHGDLAVGTAHPSLSTSGMGSVWILFLDANGTVSSYQQISDGIGGFTGAVELRDGFGFSVTNIGDFDGDDIPDLAVGARGDDDGGTDRGALWILYLNSDGTVKAHNKISDTEGNFMGTLDDADFFGRSSTSLGDLDGDGVTDLVVTATGDDDGGVTQRPIDNFGAAWVLFMHADGTVKTHQKISASEGGFSGPNASDYFLGTSVTHLGDLDGDSVTDIAISATGDGGSGLRSGAVWILFLNQDGTVKDQQLINAIEGGFAGHLEELDSFGLSVANIGDVNNDLIPDLAVGATGDDDGCSATGLDVSNCSHGAIWILLLNNDGTVENHTKISDTYGNFSATLDDFDRFGASVTAIGDQDNDGFTDLAVGVPSDDDGAPNNGALWLLKLKEAVSLPPLADTADEQLRALAYKIDTFLQSGFIVHVVASNLKGAIEDVLASLNAGLASDALLQLRRFNDLVQKYVDTGVIPPPNGGELISDAESIAALIDETLEVASERNTSANPSLFQSHVPVSFELHQNHPNPFNGSTSIHFSLPENAQVRISVFDLLGREVKRVVEDTMEAGTHTVEFNALDLPSGPYLYTIETTTGSQTRMMVLL